MGVTFSIEHTRHKNVKDIWFLRIFYGNRGLITTKPLRGKGHKRLCPIFSMKCRHNKAFNDFELGSP